MERSLDCLKSSAAMMPALRGFRLCVQRYRPGTRMPMHAHDDAGLSVVARGEVFEDSPHCPAFVARPGDCILKPVGSRHENRFGDQPSVLLQIRLSPGDDTVEWFAALQRRGYAIVRSRLLARPMLALLRTALAGSDDEETGRRSDLVADVLGALSLEARPLLRAPAWLARAERAIDDGLGERLRVGDLATALGLHPAHLTRAFHGVHGCGVVEYIRRRRVQRAAELLASGRATVCDVAQQTGFHDQAHLTRSFREMLGTTPHEYRQTCT